MSAAYLRPAEPSIIVKAVQQDSGRVIKGGTDRNS